MDQQVFRIERYRVSFISGNSVNDYQASVTLRGKDDKLVGKIFFFRDDAKKPTNTWSFGETPTLYFNLSQFSNILSLLRKHKLLALWLDRDSFHNTKYAYLETIEDELIGQEEKTPR
jgi:hypothetical protein